MKTTQIKASRTESYAFINSATAWQFMRDCDAAGVSAGFPSLDGRNVVKVGSSFVLAEGLASFRKANPVYEETDAVAAGFEQADRI